MYVSGRLTYASEMTDEDYYDRLCATCGSRWGEHYGGLGEDESDDCPVRGLDGEFYRNPNVEERTYFAEIAPLTPGTQAADIEAAAELLGSDHPIVTRAREALQC